MANEAFQADRNLVCVLFPGVVKNEEKALECLGGIKNISHVNSQPTKKRLGLSFHPENPFVKKIYADYKKTAGILLKVKVKKTKVNNEVKKEIVSTTILGRVNKMYKFDSLCDFQHLPVHTVHTLQNQEPQCILERLLPSGIDTPDFLREPGTRFILPSSFTRNEKPINYAYTDKRYPEKKVIQINSDDHVHNKRRSDRGLPSTGFNFNLTDEFPMEPHSIFLQRRDARIELNPEFAKEYNTVKKMFEERPIWTTNLIRYETKIKFTSVKIILPCLSVYIKNGPWRMLWVRYGYDPRKDPRARIYQTLDFRLRHTAGVYSMVKTRDQVVNYKKVDRVRRPARGAEEPPGSEDVPEGAVYFRPGIAPAQRQVMYQYCDVKVPEVVEMISLEPPSGYLCHPKRGWMPPNADQTCRDHIFRYVKQTLLATQNADLRLEQASSDEDVLSDDGESDSFANVLEESSNS